MLLLLCGREDWTKETSNSCSTQAVRSLVDRARLNVRALSSHHARVANDLMQPQFRQSVLRREQPTETNMHRSIFRRTVPASRLAAERVLQGVVARDVQAFPELKDQYFVFKNICRVGKQKTHSEDQVLNQTTAQEPRHGPSGTV